MKVKYPKDYKIKSQQDYFKHFCVELDKYPDVQIVGELEHANLSINIIANSDYPVMLDRADPHGLLPDFDVDSLVDPTLMKIAMKNYQVTQDMLTPTKNWAARMKNPSILNEVEKYALYSPVFVTNAHKKFASNFKHAELFPIPIALPEEIFYLSDEKNLDVYFAGSVCYWYPYRKTFTNIVKNSPNITSIILINQTGSVMTDRWKTVQEYDVQLMEYANNLRRSKATLIDGGIFNYPVKKYIEAMACGCLVLGPVPVYAEELGFVAGENMIEVDESNFKEKLEYYLSHDEERKRITHNAYDLFKERHTCKKSVERLMNKISSMK